MEQPVTKKKIARKKPVAKMSSPWYRCLICVNKTFKKPSIFNRHMLIHSKEKPFQCDVCHKQFSQKSTLKTHTLVHTQTKQHLCPHCHRPFTQKANLKVHVSRVHPDQSVPLLNRYPCPYCTCTFRGKNSMNAHKALVHANVPGLKLSRRQSKRLLMKNNVQSTDEQNNINQQATASCTIEPISKAAECNDESFASDVIQTSDGENASPNTSNLLPLMVPMPSTDIPPPTANASTGSDACDSIAPFLTLGKNNERKNECSICNTAFKRISHLRQHEKSHLGIKPHRCNICNKFFSTKSTLKVHRDKHSLHAVRYPCDQCEATFNLRSSLKRHLRQHQTYSGTLHCVTCSKTFKRAPNFRAHQLRVHQIVISEQESRVEALPTVECSDVQTMIPTSDVIDAIIITEQEPPVETLPTFECSEKRTMLPSSDQILLTVSQLEQQESVPVQQLEPIIQPNDPLDLPNDEISEVITVYNVPPNTSIVGYGNLIEMFNLNNDVMMLEHDDPVEDPIPADAFDTMNIIYPVDHDDKVDNVDLVDTADLIDSVDQLEAIDLVDAVKLVTAVEEVDAVNQMGNVNLVGPLDESFADTSRARFIDFGELTDTNLSQHRNIIVEHNSSLAPLETFPENDVRDDYYQVSLPPSEYEFSELNIKPADEIRTAEYELLNAIDSLQPSDIKGLSPIDDRSGDTPFVCDQCEKSFNLELSLLRHQELHNLNGQPFIECSVEHGDEKSLNKSSLDLQNRIYTEELQFKGPNTFQVSETFPGNDMPEEFYTVSLPPIEYEFSVLNIKPTDETKMAKSEMQSAMEPSDIKGLCSICGKYFKKCSDFQRHARTHSGEKPFVCDLCEKGFNLKLSLLRHRETHNLNRQPFIACPVVLCDKKFFSKSSLDLHKRIHTGERPFRCSICPNTFRVSGHLKAHIWAHHKELVADDSGGVIMA